MTRIETDYLVVGAGAAGLAFTDSLIAEVDTEVVMVDRRHRPGGHWRSAYPFVRLHQPSPFYGVNSRPLGQDRIDATGPNAGFYERATAVEIVDYFDRVLDEHLLPSGRVRFLGMTDHRGGEGTTHRLVSPLSGETTDVVVRRRVVDATYSESSVPSTHTPGFGVDEGAQLIPVNGLVDRRDTASGYTVIGAGKTAMDAVCWLLDTGVDPEAIRWVRPRDAWAMDRAYQQPLRQLPMLMEGLARNLEAAAAADSVADLFSRLEAAGQLVRIDPSVEPTMFRAAILSQTELDSLRRVERVVRLGRVRHIGVDSIHLDGGQIPTDAGQVHVDCTADGLRVRPARPIFEPGRITLQQVRSWQPTFNAALIGFVEAVGADDTARNALCPPNPYPDAATDWISAVRIGTDAELGFLADPQVSAWMGRSRLNAARGTIEHRDDPMMQSALARFATHAGTAGANLQRLAAEPAR